MKVFPLFVATIVAAGVVRALRAGAASVSGDDITRRDSPMAYWAILIAAIVVVALLIWEACHAI